MKMKLNNFFTSGFHFEDSEMSLKSRYQMMNVAIVLSVVGLTFGIAGNLIKDTSGLMPLELFLLCANLALFFILRINRKYFESVSNTITFEFTFLFLYLVYISQPSALKHIWLFTYPIILLYSQSTKRGIYWLSFMIIMLLIAPLQPIVSVHYSLYQVTYLSFVLLFVSIIIYFYQLKMDEAKNLILEQQNKLVGFNAELANQVEEKTANLIDLNESLEIKVQEKVEELIQKDNILTTQSKQAVMGEMISMIAHQWRQPLSTITLHISNLKIKRLLGKPVNDEETYKTFDEISDMIIYLSDTIDDFKTFFHPDKELVEIDIYLLLDKAVSFILPKLTERDIDVIVEKNEQILVTTYTNEFIQVILNLLNNAVDVLSSAQILDPKITLIVKEENDKVIVYVIDNAHGISDLDLGFIFEPYFSTKGKNGTGLGLYMSQMILQKQFNGDIKVETSENGSTFIVEIPKHIH